MQRKREEIENGVEDEEEDPEESKNLSNYYTQTNQTSDKFGDTELRSAYSTQQNV